jgi:nitrite reductase/ring-hydroxylating ferredoxin subunit
MALAGTPDIGGTDGAQPVTEPPAVAAPTQPAVTRRKLLCAAALTGACAPLLAACGGTGQAASVGNSGAGHKAGGGGAGGGGAGGAGAGAGTTVSTTNKVPKGGGIILPQDGVVITQPTPGEFNGFSSVCTHAGCTLHDVSHGTINCICHGSRFSIKNGHVVAGPAPVALPKVPIKVHGKDISLA